MFSSCLTCKHARKPRGSAMGQVLCISTDTAHEVGHVCASFEPFFSFHNAECTEAVSKLRASTTATNSPTGTISSKNPSFSTVARGAF